jgi:hypothetical protein
MAVLQTKTKQIKICSNTSCIVEVIMRSVLTSVYRAYCWMSGARIYKCITWEAGSGNKNFLWVCNPSDSLVYYMWRSANSTLISAYRTARNHVDYLPPKVFASTAGFSSNIFMFWHLTYSNRPYTPKSAYFSLSIYSFSLYNMRRIWTNFNLFYLM